MTDQPDITPPEADPDAELLSDEEIAIAGETAEDGEAPGGEDDPSVDHEPTVTL